MNEKTNLEKAFNLFLKADSSKKSFQKIYERDGFTIATEGSSLIRVRNEDCDFEVEKTEFVGLSSKRVVPKTNRSDILTFGADFFEPYKTETELEYVGEDIECATCNGFSEVEWSFKNHTSFFDCPDCDGTGLSEMKTGRETGGKTFGYQRVKLNNTYLKVTYFYKLIQVQELIGGNIELSSLGSSSDPVLFRIKDCEIIIMPVIHDHNSNYEVIDLTNQLKNN